LFLPDDHMNARGNTSCDEIRNQYFATIDGSHSDIELFSLMSLACLGVVPEDTPPPVDGALGCERYHIAHDGHVGIVFCLECDRLVEVGEIEAIKARLRDGRRRDDRDVSVLCIINHQKSLPVEQREVENAVPLDVGRLAEQAGITLVTAPDLRFLVQGVKERGWDADLIKDLMFAPGRQGMLPPGYRKVGKCKHFYARPSVISVQIEDGETVKLGETLGVRVAGEPHEEVIGSLQIERRSVPAATGPL
jgi:hypothetical protein